MLGASCMEICIAWQETGEDKTLTPCKLLEWNHYKQNRAVEILVPTFEFSALLFGFEFDAQDNNCMYIDNSI